MKRIVAILLLLCMLAACQPTPETEFVVNKSDNTIEQRLSETEMPKEERVGQQSHTDKEETAVQRTLYPDEWREDAYQVNDRTTIEFDAEIVQKKDGVYPVYRTRGRQFTEADCIELVSKILPKPTAVHDDKMTKEDLTREFKNWLEEVEEQRAWIAAGRPNDGKDRDESDIPQSFVDEESAWFMQEIAKAPDTIPETAVSDYSTLQLGGNRIYTLSDGRTASVCVDPKMISVWLDCMSFGYVYSYDMYKREAETDPDMRKDWREPVITQAEAENMLCKTLEMLDMTDFSVRSVQKGNLFHDIGGKSVHVEAGWIFKLTHDYGGYPQSVVPFMPSQQLSYAANDGFSANKWIDEESLAILIGPNGVASFEYSCAKDVVGVENPNVELLSWEDAQMRIKNALKMTLPVTFLEERGYVMKLHIYRILLTTYTIRARNSDDYYEMPCWVLFYDSDVRDEGNLSFYDTVYTEEFWEDMRNNTQLMHETLIVNAIDGSVVYTDYGRD